MIKKIFSCREFGTKIKIMLFMTAFFAVSGTSYGQSVYTEDFGSSATVALPYVFGTNATGAATKDVNFTSPSWNQSPFASMNFAGNTGGCMSATTSILGVNQVLTCTFTVAAGYSLNPTSIGYQYRISSTGPTTLNSSISGTTGGTASIAAVSTTRSGAFVTAPGLSSYTTTPALTGTITLTITLSGQTGTGGTERIDNIILNGTVTPLGIITVANGDWNTGATWSGGVVPTSAQNAVVAHAVTSGVAITRDAGVTTTIASTGSLAMGNTYTNNGTTNVSGGFIINNGGWGTGNDFAYSTGSSLTFTTTFDYGVNATDAYWPTTAGSRPTNVNVTSGGLVLASGAAKVVDGTFTTSGNSGLGISIGSGASLTINGICRINSGGYFANTGAPIYGAASTLQYNTGGTYGRNYEWNAAGVGTIGSTPGYPNNVQLSSSTTLNYTNITPVNIKAMAGNLVVDAGSSFNMDYNGISTAGALVVAGNVSVAGSLRLGTVLGDDLKMGGNLAFTGTGNLVGNNRAIFFTKNGTQTVSSVAALDIPYVVLMPTSGVTRVQLFSNLSVSAGTTGPAVIFGNATDILDLNGYNITIGTVGVSNTISGSGTFAGNVASNMTLNGLGSIGTIYFTTGFQNLGTLTLNRENGLLGCTLGTALTVNTGVVLTNGLLDVGNNPLTLSAAATVSATAIASNYIIVDLASGSLASLRKVYTAAGSFTYLIGDKSGMPSTLHYSPVTVNFGSGTFSSAYAGMAVDDIKEPNMDATTHFITRYWSMTTSGITSPTYSVTGTYLPGDVVGIESQSLSNQWNGSAWTNGGAPIGSNTMTIGGCTTVPAVNHFTGGLRDPEINIKQTATNYLTGSIYDFGTQLTGSNTSVTFTIESLGQQNLNLGAATITGNPPYSLTANYTTPVLGPLGTTTFTIKFSPVAAGTFSGSISIPNNDASGAENPYIINFTGIGTTPAPEINLKGYTVGTNNIISGSITVSGLNNTSYGTIALGSNVSKDFEIQNIGTAVLNLTGVPIVSIGGTNPGDFTVTTVPSSSTVAISSSVTFVITFAPTALGVRSAVVSIANNDSDENPYTYLIQGSCTCATAINTLTPTSGPVGTEIIVTATANNLTGATATIGGVSAVVTPVSSTQIKVTVPVGALSGNLVTTNSQGCSASTNFTVIKNVNTACAGGSASSDIFISEVTDATTGGTTYVEIYNGTGNPVFLGNYSLQTFSNGGAAYSSSINLNSVTLNSGSIFVLAIGISSSPDVTDTCIGLAGSNGEFANQTSAGGGINFVIGGNDHLALFNNTTNTKIDSFGTYGSGTWADALGLGDRGVDFRRKNTAVLATTTFSNSDWVITDWAGSGAGSCGTNDYSNIGLYTFTVGTPPTVTVHPTYTPTCKSTTLTVAGTEGNAAAPGLAYQWFSVAPNVATWTSLTNAGVYSGTTTATLAISNVTGLDGYQYYCQIREDLVTCYSASNAVKITDAQTVTWNGAVWSPNAPTIASIVVINGNYNTTTYGSFECCSMTVNSPSTVTITSNYFVSIKNDLTVSAGGNLIVQNQGSLVMIEDTGVVTNSGSTTVQKTTAPYERYDYTYWSSPVAGNTIGSTFSAWRTDYSFTFDTANFADLNNDTFDDAAPWAWTNTGTAAVMTPGKGYAIMAPTTGTFPTTSSVVFSGAANNGVITMPVAESGNAADANDDYNLIGNPYASALYANTFILNNPAISGTLYFWTHVSDISVSNPGPNSQNFISNDYAVYNLSGGTRASLTGSPVPTGYISSGQGFLVEATGAGNVTFNNAMRNKTYSNSQFFRNASAQVAELAKNRIWLNLQNQDGMFSQQLIGYFDEATSGIDRGYDGIVNKSRNYISFYSFIGNEKFRIQGRPTFDVNDRVSLGYSAVVEGTFNISIDNTEGILNGSETNIYLEDRLLNVIHDLKQGPYVFTTAIGTFDDRFVLRYTNTALSDANFVVNDNTVLISANDTEIKIKSDNELIDSIIVYDVLGRTVLQSNEIGSRSFVTDKVTAHQQALIVRITLANRQVVVKKIIF